MDPFIYIKNNTLTEKFCKNLIEKFEKDSKKVPGVTDYSRETSDIKKSTDLCISHYDDWKKEDDILFSILSREYTNYLNHISNMNPAFLKYFSNYVNGVQLNDCGYQIQRTTPGEYYDWHCDSDITAAIQYDNYTESRGLRVATYLWYLNDVEYDGETEFIDGTKVKPETGKLLIFPATITYLHRGISPKKETKYICTGWMSIKN